MVPTRRYKYKCISAARLADQITWMGSANICKHCDQPGPVDAERASLDNSRKFLHQFHSEIGLVATRASAGPIRVDSTP